MNGHCYLEKSIYLEILHYCLIHFASAVHFEAYSCLDHMNYHYPSFETFSDYQILRSDPLALSRNMKSPYFECYQPSKASEMFFLLLVSNY